MKLQADQQFTVYITPLTPIHIGCAVDYEPTDTLIHDKNLYHLKDLANWQGAERASLASALARANDFASIQTAFKNKSNALSPLAPRPVSMPFDGVWTENRGKIKTIERTAFNAVTGNPIIPGSALKGALGTAYIEMNGAIGEKEHNILRQLKISDSDYLGAIQTSVFARAIRHRKNLSKSMIHPADKYSKESGSNFVECVLPAQKNAFTQHWSFNSAPKLASLKIYDLLRSFSNHTIQTIERELFLQGRLIDDNHPLNKWWKANENSIIHLLEKGAALIKIGRHIGAEQLTNSRGRNIVTAHNTLYPTSTTLPMSTNEKLAAPFGFALLIPAYACAACDPLLDALLAQMPAEQAALAKAQQAHAKHLEHANVQRQQWVLDAQAAQQAAADQAQAAKAQAAAAQAALDKAASQSPQQNAIDELVTQCVALQPLMVQRKGKLFGINDAVFSGFKKLVLQAVDPSWNDTDKKLLADTVKQHLPTLVAGYGDDKDGRKALKKLLEPLNLPAAA
jgi:CRISPR-associated protein Csm5